MDPPAIRTPPDHEVLGRHPRNGPRPAPLPLLALPTLAEVRPGDPRTPRGGEDPVGPLGGEGPGRSAGEALGITAPGPPGREGGKQEGLPEPGSLGPVYCSHAAEADEGYNLVFT